MIKFINAIQIIAALIPVIKEFIEAVEAPGYGAEKKKAVMDVVEAILNVISPLHLPKETILGVVSGLIDVFVQLANITGKFIKKDVPVSNPSTQA